MESMLNFRVTRCRIAGFRGRLWRRRHRSDMAIWVAREFPEQRVRRAESRVVSRRIARMPDADAAARDSERRSQCRGAGDTFAALRDVSRESHRGDEPSPNRAELAERPRNRQAPHHRARRYARGARSTPLKKSAEIAGLHLVEPGVHAGRDAHMTGPAASVAKQSDAIGQLYGCSWRALRRRQGNQGSWWDRSCRRRMESNA